jgi:crotonobetainyl-CoA:carnitine CoA-transferase CaiB-like acyl-CoA transferase
VPAPPQPLAGLRVVEFTHMVMGPTCGMVLADLGAEVIKVEPLEGEGTRRLLGAGAGFFPPFQSQQAQHRHRPKAGRRRRHRASPGPQRRRGGREPAGRAT